VIDLAGKLAIVTGGSSGMGEAIAQCFEALGATVEVFDLNEPGSGCGAGYHRVDVSSEIDWQRAVGQVATKHGRLDVLVNCAGILRCQNIEETDIETWDLTIDTNVKGAMLGCREAIKLMKENPGGPIGSIINVSSALGKVGASYAAGYSASKGALTLLTKSVSNYCARTYKTIRCNSVHPGTMQTPMLEAELANYDNAEMVERFKTASIAQSPMNRLGAAGEVTGAVAFLASDECSSYITGTSIDVDGGWLAAGGSL